LASGDYISRDAAAPNGFIAGHYRQPLGGCVIRHHPQQVRFDALEKLAGRQPATA
jgi:hypothetical protein